METLDELPDDVAQLKAIILTMKARNEHLEKLIRAIRDAAFGRRSEKLSEEQFQLALEDLEVGISRIEAEKEADQVPPSASPKKPRSVNRGSLPKHLLRIEETIEPKTTVCACGCQMHVIGEDVSERLDVIPAQFRVIVTRRPKYGCRACESAIVQVPAPARLIPGGIPTEAMVAHVLTAKFADHLPLYRQAQIYSRQGIELDRSTLADWVGRAAYELRPVFDCLLTNLKRSTKLFMDETRAPVLDPGRRRTKTGYLPSMSADIDPFRDGLRGLLARNGLSLVTIGPGAGPIHQASPIAMHPVAAASMPSASSKASAASCKLTVTPATTG